ncbi:response regulator [Fodinicola feengrottensis]|uniref:hypothetical protein n=1 Tax=Fodinicola feengrottensis TaxID=435914 RepID=UPI0028BE3E85|nr:hypothetical protein [Fodinicola feengrottensis]
MLAETLSRALRGFGHEVVVTPSGEQALESLFERREPAEVVLLDVMLPGIDGFEGLPPHQGGRRAPGHPAHRSR